MPGAGCAAALSAFYEAGGVVCFFVFEGDGSAECHRAATLAAHAELAAALTVTLTAEPRIAAWISGEEFIGTVSSSEGVFLEPGAFLSARAEAMAAQRSHSGPVGEGLGFAFADPPYTLKPRSPVDAAGWWRTIGEELFDSFTEKLEIARWTSDWSTYFEPGLEWWGAFWWTVYVPAQRQVVVVAASATD